jgi:hypothetical protein
MSTSASTGRLEFGLSLVLIVLAIVVVPLFVCLPPYSDNDFYGIAANYIRKGYILEKEDRSFYFPPGLALSRLGIDTLSGRRHEGIIIADLLVMSANFALLVAWFRYRLTRSQAIASWLILMAFYLSTPEACHFQPDPWMFLPTLAGLHLRRKQLPALLDVGPVPKGRLMGRSLLEGMMCGAGCLIKPQAIVPMLTIWTVSSLLALRLNSRQWKRTILDVVLLLSGGAICAAFWLLWLVFDGGLLHFRDTFLWAYTYYSTAASWPLKLLATFTQFLPWSLVHLWAVPLSLVLLVRAGRQALRGAANQPDGRVWIEALYSAFYLAWAFEGTFMQVSWIYHIMPGLFAGLGLLISRLWSKPMSLPGWVAPTAAAGFAIGLNPLLMPHKLACWPRCFTEGSTPALRDELENIPYYMPHIVEQVDPVRLERLVDYGKFDLALAQMHSRIYVVEWENMARVADYLRSQGVADRDLTCYHNTTLHLFLMLDVIPSNCDIVHDLIVSRFHGRDVVLQKELENSRQRWVVSDLQRATLDDPPPPDPAHPLELPANFPQGWRDKYPWSLPIVFRAGRYCVHDAKNQKVTKLTGLVYPDE